MAKIRLNMEVSEDLVRLMDNLAEKEHVTRTEIVRRGLSVMKAFEEQIKAGRVHLGFTAEPQDLDAEMLGILTPPVEHIGGAASNTDQKGASADTTNVRAA